MKVRLLHPDRDLDLEVVPARSATSLSDDLGLEHLVTAMAAGDRQVEQVSRTVLLDPLDDLEVIRYRQAVIADAVSDAATMRSMYRTLGEGLERARRSAAGLFRDTPDATLRRSIERLRIHTDVLRTLRTQVAAGRTPSSEGFGALVAELEERFSEPRLREVEAMLDELGFPRGVLLSARVGRGGRPVGHQLRAMPERGWLTRSVGRTGDSFELAERDDDAIEALGQWREQALAPVAAVVSQASEDVEVFLSRLRDELAFLVGCGVLHERLRTIGVATCTPELRADGPHLEAEAIVDPVLALELRQAPVANDVAAGDAILVLITGANQGGKSTLLRALGLAQQLAQVGMFVAAGSFSASLTTRVHTHFGREEDRTLRRGKLEEELDRMRAISDRIRPGDLLLANESFAATNEREGSELARQVIRAYLDAGVRVVAVTHLFDLADSLHRDESHRGVFLRAEREEDGGRTHRVTPGAPLPTSYGQDLYRRIFGAPVPPRS